MTSRPMPISEFGRVRPGTVSILDVPIDSLTMKQALDRVRAFMQHPRVHQVATVNPEFVMTAQDDTAFLKILKEADLCLADGIGLLIAGRWIGKPVPERVAGSDFVYKVAGLAAENGWRLFLLGAAPGVAEEAAAIFKNSFPDLIIAGTYAGSPDKSHNQAIVKRVNDSRADILYVAYGAPKQDKWIARNLQTLETVRVAVGVGGSLDFVTGRATRAPRWAQNAGLEWMHRLYKEPWRWKRMLALPRFALKIIRQGK